MLPSSEVVMVKYLGYGEFEVDGETMQYDFVNECFPEGFADAVYKEAFADPNFQLSMKRANAVYRVSLRLGQEYAEEVLAEGMW